MGCMHVSKYGMWVRTRVRPWGWWYRHVRRPTPAPAAWPASQPIHTHPSTQQSNVGSSHIVHHYMVEYMCIRALMRMYSCNMLLRYAYHTCMHVCTWRLTHVKSTLSLPRATLGRRECKREIDKERKEDRQTEKKEMHAFYLESMIAEDNAGWIALHHVDDGVHICYNRTNQGKEGKRAQVWTILPSPIAIVFPLDSLNHSLNKNKNNNNNNNRLTITSSNPVARMPYLDRRVGRWGRQWSGSGGVAGGVVWAPPLSRLATTTSLPYSQRGIDHSPTIQHDNGRWFGVRKCLSRRVVGTVIYPSIGPPMHAFNHPGMYSHSNNNPCQTLGSIAVASLSHG